MAIFDNELVDNIAGDPSLEGPASVLGSIKPTNDVIYNGGAMFAPVSKKGLSLAELEQIGNTTSVPKGFGASFATVGADELQANQRYPIFQRGADLEEINAANQTWYQALGNGLGRLGITMVGTVAQSFTNIPNTISAVKSGQLSDLSGDPEGYEGTIDNWIKNSAQTLPVYQSQYNKENPYLSAIPFMKGSSYFWGEQFLPNLGFMAGAATGAAIQDIAVGAVTGGIGELPLVASQVGKAALYLNKIFSAESKLGRVLGATQLSSLTRLTNLGEELGKSVKQLDKIGDLAALAAATKLTNKFRVGVALAGTSMTEASVESRGGYRDVKEGLINQYKAENLGAEPDGQAMFEIEAAAKNAMNTKFGINMAILGVSNSLFLGNMFKSMIGGVGGRAITGSLVQSVEGAGKIGLEQGSLDVFEKKAATTLAGKVWDGIKATGTDVFREGVYEEGGQFAAEKGVYDYYTRKYKNPKDKENVKTWNTLNEIIKSTVYGMKEQFGSDEGLQNMFIGGLTGMVSGKVMSIIDNKRGVGADARLQTAINIVNQQGLTSTIQRKYDDTTTSVAIAKEMQEAAASGNVFKYKNLQDKAFFSFVNSRVAYGMHDTTVEQLKMLKDLPKDQFQDLFQLDFNATNKETVGEYVDALISKANEINSTMNAINNTFQNPFKKAFDANNINSIIEANNHNTFEDYKSDLGYYASIAPNVNRRLANIQESVSNVSPLVTNDALQQLTSLQGLTELKDFYEKQADNLNKTITDLTAPLDKKSIRDQVKALRTKSDKIADVLNNEGKLDDKTFEELLNFEVNNQDASKPRAIPMDRIQELMEYGLDISRLDKSKTDAAKAYDSLSTKEGFTKYFEEASEMAADKEAFAAEEGEVAAEETIAPTEEVKPMPSPSFVFNNARNQREVFEIGSEYEIGKFTKAKVNKVADDRWQTVSPDGTFEMYPTKEKAQEAAAELDDEFANLSKVKVLNLNEDGSIKVEDKNGDRYNVSPRKFSGFNKIETAQEKLQKASVQVEKQQKQIEIKSGTVTTGNPSTEVVSKEDPLRAANRFFITTIGAAEANELPENIKPHQVRSREFLNNFKNFPNKGKIKTILLTYNQEKGLGLDGISKVAYNKQVLTDADITNITNIEKGLVVAVYVEQDGKDLYFVDKAGKKILDENNKPVKLRENVDVNKVVFSTMPTSEIYYTYKDKNGDPVPRFRQGEEEEFKRYAAAWKDLRTQLFEAPVNKVRTYGFSITRGFGKENRINGKMQKNFVGNNLIPESKIKGQDNLIIISTKGTLEHQGDNLPYPVGRPVLQYGDTLQFLNNRTFNTNEAKSIFEAIRLLAEDLQTKVDKGDLAELNPKYTSFLQNVLYWRKTADTKNNQIYVNPADMTISLGGQSFPISGIASQEAKIVAQLKETFSAINNTSVKTSSEPFTELYFEDSYLKDRTWPNYQSYLLASQYPSGKARSINDTPLATAIGAPTDAVPYNYEQKAAQLSGLELSVQKVEKPKVVAAAPVAERVGDFEMDNKTPNTTPMKVLGDVTFVAKIVNNGAVVTVSDIENIDELLEKNEATNGQTLAPYFDALKGANLFDATRNDKELMLDFASIFISNKLNAMRAEAPVVETAATVTQTTPYGTEAGPTLTTSTESVQENMQAAEDLEDTVGEDDLEASLQAEIQRQIAQKTKDMSKTKRPNSGKYSIVVDTDVARISAAELKIFKKWHAENAANIPYEILEHILTTHNGDAAWGSYENRIAKFYKMAERGREYHEIFHAIWENFLTGEEQQILRDEFRAKPGKFKDRDTGKMLYYEEATDLQIEERIAEDFADFRLGKISAKSMGQHVLDFFKNIMQFVKDFVRKPSKKDELFKAIDSGKFKNKPLLNTEYSNLIKYSVIPGFTQQATRMLVQDMSYRFFQKTYGTNKNFYDPNLLSAPVTFQTIKDEYLEEGKLSLLEEEGWNILVSKSKDYLHSLKNVFDQDNALSINTEETNNRDYAAEPFSTDWKKNSPFPIKLAVATLPKTLPTSQEDEFSLTLPEEDFSSVEGFQILNFSRAFATILDKVSNTTSINKMVENVIDLAKSNSDYVRLFTRLKGDITNLTIDFANYTNEDWRLFINFTQSFAKQKPNARIQYITGTEVYTGSANLFNAASDITSTWIENIKDLAKDDQSLITYNRKTKTYQVGNLANTSVGTPEQMIEFLKNLGVDFPMSAYLKLKEKEANYFARSVSGILTSLRSKSDIMSITDRVLDVSGPLNMLAEILVTATNPNQDPTYRGVEGESTNSYSDNNAPSLFENEWAEAGTLEQLKATRPELNDVFSTNSLLLEKGGTYINDDGEIKRLLKVGYIQGSKEIDDNEGIKTTKLSLGARYTQEINENLNGRFYILLPGDSSTEWSMNIGNNITYKSFGAGSAWTKIYKTFKGYLKDDIALAKDADARKVLKNIGDRAYDLRFFKDILSDDMLAKINTQIVNKADVSDADIETFITSNEEEINMSVKAYIDSTVNETLDTLKDNNQVVRSEKLWSYPMLNSVFANDNQVNKFKLSDDKLRSIINYTNVNYIIANIEYHKVLFGDPYQFAIKDGQLEETKRIKSFLSPRRTTFDMPEFNTFLKETYNKAKEIQLTENDPGYQNYKSYVNTVTIKEIEIEGSLMGKTKEADAQSWIMDNTYKEVKLKNSQWSPEAEAWHQYEMAYTRTKLADKNVYTYTNSSLQKQDLATLKGKKPVFVKEVLKPIVTGNKMGKTNFDQVLDKFSQMPLYYSNVEGRTLEALYIKMWKEKVGYAIMQSGRKEGIEKMHDFYVGGKFNDAPFAEDTFVQVPWKTYGIQVENSYDHAKSQTRGSQGTKMSTMDLYKNGKAVSPKAEAAVTRNTDLLRKMFNNSYKSLLEKLGIEDLGGQFRLIDNYAVSETLLYEMLRRQLSDNAKATIRLNDAGQFPLPFEASPSYKQIKDILYSTVNKTIVSPSVSGGPKVQVSVTGWEDAKQGRSLALKTEEGYKKISRAEYDALSEEEKAKVVMTEDTLKFYTEKDPYMEVLLPHWFGQSLRVGKYKTDAELLNYLNSGSADLKSILNGIGFRIPTQALSSMENFRVKGFLPQDMGDSIVVPSEITTKAGSDFDIDKLNTYLKSIYIDKYGDIQLVKYLGSEEATKDFFSKVFTDTIQVKLDKLGRYNEFRDSLLNVFSKTQDLVKPTNQAIVDALTDEEADFFYDHLSIIQEIITQASEQDLSPTEYMTDQIEELDVAKDNLKKKLLNSKLKDRYIKDMYKRALENEYYNSLEELLTLPENFKRLTSPVGDAGLEKLSEKLDKLKNYDETKIKNRLLNRNFMTSLRHALVTAKRWVGIVATSITSHAQLQKGNVYINPNKFAGLPKLDKLYLGDGSIILPHNTVMVDDKPYTSLSGIKTADDQQYISDRLSGYGTATVDVANKPYIVKVIPSELAIGTVLFLERIGAGEFSPMFIQQPIVLEYLKYLDSMGSKNLFNKTNIDRILSKFETKDEFIPKNTGIQIKNFEDNISKYAATKDLGEQRNGEQHAILREFLKYAKMADYNFDLTQAINYDTTRYKNGDTLFKKKTRSGLAINKGIFENVQEVIDKTFIGEELYVLESSMEAMGEIFKLEQDQFRIITNSLLRPYAENKYIGIDKFDKIANKLKASFLDYIIQTKTILGDQVKPLFVDASTNAALQIAEAKKISVNPILEEFKTKSSDLIDGAKVIGLKVNPKSSPIDEDTFIGYMRELRDDPKTNELYKNLVKVAILQGSYQSAYTFSNIIPIEDYSEYITPIIAPLTSDETLDAFADGMFQRNNFKNPDIFAKFTPKFFSSEEDFVEEQVNEYGDHIADIYQYSSSAYFPHIPHRFGNSSDRRILTLSETWNSFHLGNDYLLINRVVLNNVNTGERVDMKTGQTITNYSYIERKKLGDTTLNEVYGYKRVRDTAGNPVTFSETNYKQEVDVKHVYKLINLYSDGNSVPEYYQDFRPSVINNNTVKIKTEIPDEEIISYFGALSAENAISSQPQMEAGILPNYSFDLELKNADGSKRFAQTDGINIKINPPNNSAEFFDYFEGNEGGQTSLQKAKVIDKLADAGYPIDVLKAALNNNVSIVNFLVLHEQDHIDNNDKDVYWTNGKDLLTEDKIDIETRATINALKKLGVNPTNTAVEEVLQLPTVPGEVRYKDAEKRIKIEYPSKIETANASFDTSKLLEIQKVFSGVDDDTVADGRDFAYADLKEYGMTDSEYEYAKNNEDVLASLLDVAHEQWRDVEYTNFSETIERLLKENEKLVDTAQTDLFANVDENDTEGSDNPNPCGTKSK